MRDSCIHCKKEFTESWQRKYCSNQCQADARYAAFQSDWITGAKRVVTKNVSRHIKRFLIERFGESCSECGWKRKHPKTGKVPIEVDHINGDSDDNSVKNLRLLCPNCHSLTHSFRNLNKGNGRARRRRQL